MAVSEETQQESPQNEAETGFGTGLRGIANVRRVVRKLRREQRLAEHDAFVEKVVDEVKKQMRTQATLRDEIHKLTPHEQAQVRNVNRRLSTQQHRLSRRLLARGRSGFRHRHAQRLAADILRRARTELAVEEKGKHQKHKQTEKQQQQEQEQE